MPFFPFCIGNIGVFSPSCSSFFEPPCMKSVSSPSVLCRLWVLFPPKRHPLASFFASQPHLVSFPPKIRCRGRTTMLFFFFSGCAPPPFFPFSPPFYASSTPHSPVVRSARFSFFDDPTSLPCGSPLKTVVDREIPPPLPLLVLTFFFSCFFPFLITIDPSARNDARSTSLCTRSPSS